MGERDGRKVRFDREMDSEQLRNEHAGQHKLRSSGSRNHQTNSAYGGDQRTEHNESQQDNASTHGHQFSEKFLGESNHHNNGNNRESDTVSRASNFSYRSPSGLSQHSRKLKKKKHKKSGQKLAIERGSTEKGRLMMPLFNLKSTSQLLPAGRPFDQPKNLLKVSN